MHWLTRHQINSENYLNLLEKIIHLSVYNCTLGIESTIIQRYFTCKGN